jgi:hypothetical protein
METPKEYYYTYYSYEEWGKGYFGSRKCYCLPEEDVKYFGSFCDKNFKPTQKIILKSDYATREEAYADEIILQEHYKVVENPHFANRSYQTTTKFCLSREQAIENGRKVGKITGKKCYELGLGIFSLTKEERKIASLKGASIGGRRNVELGTGIFSMTEEERKIASSKGGKLGGKNGGEKVKELGIGIHALTTEQRSKNGKKIGQKHKENGTGVCGIPTEQRKRMGKKSGQQHYENGTGLFAMTAEQKSEKNKKAGKTTSSQKWKCTVTGYISTPAGLSNYQRAKGIDTSKRIRIS